MLPKAIKPFKRILADRDFVQPLLSIGLLIALQNFFASSLNLIDMMMVGRLGSPQIAAVGLANQYFFLLNLFLFGVYSGATIFTAQFWGANDSHNFRRIVGIALGTGIAAGLLFALPAMIAPQAILGIFSTDVEVIALGSKFLRIMAFSYIPMSVSFCFAFLLRSTGNILLPVLVSMSALLFNTLLNYLLIYGNGGFPRLEVSGAALATLMARIVEMLILLFFIYHRRLPPAIKRNDLHGVNRAFMMRFFKTTTPVILNEFLWALGMTMYTVVYARMGTEVVAAVNISGTIERLSMVLFFGLAQACAVTVGHQIGAGVETKARSYAGRYAFFGPGIGLLIGGILLTAAGPMLSLFQVSGAVTRNAAAIMSVFSLILPVKVFNLILIVGILRSGGDTRFSLILDTAGLWCIGVPLAFLAGFWWRLPLTVVYLLANMDEVFKCVLGTFRMFSGKWLNNLTHSMQKATGESI